MEFNYSYSGDTQIENTANSTSMSFAPDTLRPKTFFSGRLRKSLEFREAISSLHDVVVSDLRWKPKDREEYKRWLDQQEAIDWVAVASEKKNLAGRIETLRHEMDELNKNVHSTMRPYYTAQKRYFDYLYKRDYDAWFVLDPVITVHPDEVFFECFSQDESSYGRLSASYEVFDDIGEFACGTTNIDYSAALYGEFQKIRTYKETRFEIDPSGFEVQTTHEENYKEVKIDLPDSWVRGFLQVSSAMSMPAVQFDLHPMDLHNLCLVLRRHREIKGPRSMRYLLKPGEPVRVSFDPWNIVVECPRSPYTGNDEQEIRVWGRRRIHILERLIPIAKSFRLFLLGQGMPSFYVADLGDMTFTLGLSGWTANDWSRAGNFDLLAPRAQVDSMTQTRVFDALRENWVETPDALATRLGLDRSIVLGALSAYTQAGRAIWDMNKKVYRVRELSREPLPMETLRFTNEREASAVRFIEAKAVSRIHSEMADDGRLRFTGVVKDAQHEYTPTATLDSDERLIAAECTCNWHQQNKLRMGPCEHILAIRKRQAS